MGSLEPWTRSRMLIPARECQKVLDAGDLPFRGVGWWATRCFGADVVFDPGSHASEFDQGKGEEGSCLFSIFD